MSEIVQSAWWIIYYIDANNDPRYLLIKRHALSWKIERVAPKGKIQNTESMETAALREVSEETGIPLNQLKIKQQLGTTSLRSAETQRGQLNKDVTYFLMEYVGDPSLVHIQAWEWYVWIYKWANMVDILSLVHYADVRELFRKSYVFLKENRKNNDIKKSFLQTLEI